MVTHVVLFRWRHALSEQERREVHDAFESLSSIDGVTELRHGADVGTRPGNADYVAIVCLPDWDTFVRYLDDPRHRHLTEVATAGITASRWSVQTESADG